MRQLGVATSYLGQYTHSVDEKGRASLPAKFRAGGDETFVVTRGIGPCLFLYPKSEWQKVLDRLDRQKARTDARQRRMYLQLMRHTAEAALDAQGRVTIPSPLAELAGIEDDVVFVGAGDTIEMWEPGRYAEYLEGAEDDFESWLAEFL